MTRIKTGKFIKCKICNKEFYVIKARLVMEKHLGRYLSGSEVVHHCGDKNDNTIHKLICFTSNRAHIRFHKNPLNVNLEEIICDGRKIIIPLAGNL